MKADNKRTRQTQSVRQIGHMLTDRGSAKVVPISYGDQRRLAQKAGDLVVVPSLTDAMAFLERRAEIGIQWSALLATYDADMECAHGALPTDATYPKGCTCWAQESTNQGRDVA